VDVDVVAKIVMDTSANKDGYIYGVVPMSEEDVKSILRDAFRA